MLRGKVAIVGHGITTAMSLALHQSLREKDIIVIDSEGKSGEDLEKEIQLHQLPEPSYADFSKIEIHVPPRLEYDGQHINKPTCKKHHEYVKVKDEGFATQNSSIIYGVWECRFCCKKLYS